MMRTTLNLPEDVYEVARSVAESKDISLGDALAELVRRGLSPQPRIHEEEGFPCFTVPPDASPITLAQTLAAEDAL
jgi:hypothetical protein